MRLLFDTHILLDVIHAGLSNTFSPYRKLLGSRDVTAFASVASLWEVSIKARLGKLDPGMALEELADYLEAIGLFILDIDRRHAVASIEPEPATRDPFDRMLLAQCQVEALQLVTLDGALISHPLAFRESI